jgi:hypothetical protein
MKARKLLLKVVVVAVFVTCFALGMAHAQIKGVYPDLGDWADTWFKVSLTRTVYCFDDVGVKSVPSYPVPQTMGTVYLKITSWDGINHILTADIYVKDHDTGQWVTTPFATIDIEYFSGTALKFIASAQFVSPGDVTLNLVFVFTGKKDLSNNFVLGGVTKLGTTASSMLEIDDVEGSTERWAGSVKLSGPMVPVSKLPDPLKGL